MKTAYLALLAIALSTACSSTKPAEAPESSAAPSAASPSAASDQTTAAQKPDVAKARTHLEQHVTYPATRAEVLAACANTPEFSDAEKRWISDNLPDGKYDSATDVEKALKL